MAARIVGNLKSIVITNKSTYDYLIKLKFIVKIGLIQCHFMIYALLYK